MSPKTPCYPGDRATPDDVLALARAYHRAAALLRPPGGPGDPARWAPFHLVAVHATELYLNALLRARGVAPVGLRAMQHDLARRADHPAVVALRLRERTTGHLRALTESRVYLVARYASLPDGPCSRMDATLEEVARKVAAALERG